ncbi:hypothetical protein N9I08_00590 [Candidatus Pelagibacter sp.]|jgi:hypothetical protein|nr:hypothetical protein [Candidatus Pelagibacter sp.]|tara:strand:+ start:311 stop:775 length:465 start_codon:yes stop_codon:yes gene_type:complete
MPKNYLLIILFIFTTSCGYEAVYSLKNRVINTDFSITEVSLNGDRDLNIQIKKRLDNYNKVEKSKNYILDIVTKAERIVIANDSKGDPSKYKLQVTIIIAAKTENINNIQIEFIESFNYNNITDKFELERSEREIKNNLAETITAKLISELMNY